MESRRARDVDCVRDERDVAVVWVRKVRSADCFAIDSMVMVSVIHAPLKRELDGRRDLLSSSVDDEEAHSTSERGTNYYRHDFSGRHKARAKAPTSELRSAVIGDMPRASLGRLAPTSLAFRD